MKTMTQIVESIKNAELRAFAIKLQQKLEQAKNAIVSKKKKVSGAEQSALRNSVSKFADANRGKLPQKVAGLLALTMLTTMLASCDELDGPGFGRPGGEGTTTSENIGSDEGYEKLLASELGLFGVLKELDFAYLYYSEEGQEFLDEYYAKFLSEVEKYPGEPDIVSYSGYNVYRNLTSESDKRLNIIWSMDSENTKSDWSHTLVSTADDFALLSEIGGQYFITGFVNGKVYDGTRGIGSKDFATLQKAVKQNGYEETMNKCRDEFWGLMARYDSSKAEKYKLNAWFEEKWVFEDDGVTPKPPTEFKYTFIKIGIESLKTGKELAKIDFEYDIPDNYLDQYLHIANENGQFNGGGNKHPNYYDDYYYEDETEFKETTIYEEPTEEVTEKETYPEWLPPECREDYTEETFPEEETTEALSEFTIQS